MKPDLVAILFFLTAAGCGTGKIPATNADPLKSLPVPSSIPTATTPSIENKSSMDAHPAQPTPSPANSIGQATMNPDGTIVLDLRASGPGGAMGDARLTYPPDHKNYRMILNHLGGIKPGEVKPVAPFN